MRNFLRYLMVTFSILLLPACSSAAEGEIETEQRAVVYLKTEISKTEISGCSGALIAPNLVLTARHCVSALKTGLEITSCENARFDTTIKPKLPTIYATPEHEGSIQDMPNVLAQTKFVAKTESDAVCGNDIAILVLDRKIPIDTIRPLDIRFKPQALKSESYALLGFGRATLELEPPTRRIHDGFIDCISTVCKTPRAGHEIQGSSYACSGDSGGPILDAEGRIIGVLSRAIRPVAEAGTEDTESKTPPCGTPSTMLMVEPLGYWIKTVMEENP